MDNNTLSHTTWECKYHVVFASKYRGINCERKYNMTATSCYRHVLKKGDFNTPPAPIFQKENGGATI